MKPDWWPAGCKERYVRECSCSYCTELAEALDEWKQGQSPDGEHRRLDAFG